ncbi:hypothetical protein PDIDSM_8551 [Penicillium digitatum]|nr:hypothetical protein PDIDSM_8551 [Penicillium digitatum]
MPPSSLVPSPEIFTLLNGLHTKFLIQESTTVVEAGTSFGVSTIYLALAVTENAKRVNAPTKPRVIATEKEESKAKLARAH